MTTERTTHTPGPWIHERGEHVPDGGDRVSQVIRTPNGRMLVKALGLPPLGEMWANAALIARAPELDAEVTRLRALNARMEQVLRRLDDDGRRFGNGAFERGCSCLWCTARAILAELDASAEKQRTLAEPGGGYYENTMRDAGRGGLLR